MGYVQRSLLIALLAASLSGCLVATAPVTLTSWVRWEQPDENYLEGNLTWSGGRTTSGGLSGRIVWGTNTGTQDPVDANDAVRSGQSAAAGILEENTGSDGGVGFPTDEFVSQPLPRELHLNVSRLIELDVRVSVPHTWSGECPVSMDVELFAGEKRIAGAVGKHYVQEWWAWNGAPPPEPDGYHTCYFRMPSEVAQLEAGTVLRLVIHRRYYESQDWTFGFAGDHNTVLRLAAYSADELVYRNPQERSSDEEGSVVVKEDVVAAGGTQQDQEVAWSEVATGLSVASLGPSFLLGLRRPRGRSILAIVLLLSLLLSGCLRAGGKGGPEGTDDEPGGFASQTLIRSGTGNGSILGLVHDPFHLPLRNVHVSLLGTPLFERTDGQGRFSFRDLAAATLRLRFDHVDYKGFETEVQVLTGTVTRLDVTLVPRVAKFGDDRPHIHDYWNGQTTVKLGEVVLTPNLCGPVDAVINAALLSTCLPAPLLFSVPSLADKPNTVLPGAREVEVRIEWDTAKAGFDRLGLWFYPNNDPWNQSQLYPRKSGEPFRIAVNWEMTDVGHQLYSSWQFETYLAPGDDVPAARRSDRLQWAVSGPPTFRATIWVHRAGALPLEPAHPDFWAGKDTYEVLKKTTQSSTGYWSPASNRVVPPGTGELELTYEVRSGSPVACIPILHYHPANQPPDWDYTKWPKADAPRVEGSKYTWRLKTPPEWADIPYAKVSNWGFYFAEGRPQVAGQETYCNDYDYVTRQSGSYSLAITAHRAR